VGSNAVPRNNELISANDELLEANCGKLEATVRAERKSHVLTDVAISPGRSVVKKRKPQETNLTTHGMTY
jgi:hypothetical protein